jgi:dolichyl-phosphate beta-glucosyltransferase
MEVARAFQKSWPRVELLGYPVNRGKGFAVKTGVLASRHPAVLVSDADHSTPIGELERLYKRYEEGYDVVIGSRGVLSPRIEVRQPLNRKIAGRIFNALVGSLGLRGIADTQCGFKLFRREAARAIFSMLVIEGFAFDVEVLLRARAMGFRIAEVGVKWYHSSNSRVRMVRDSVHMFLDVMRLRIGS